MLDAKTLVVNERANAIVMRDTPENVRMAEKLVASVDLAEPEVMMEVEVLEITRSRLQQLGISLPRASVTRRDTDRTWCSTTSSNQNGSTITRLAAVGDRSMRSRPPANANVLASPRIRARNKEKAKILIGSRVPVITTAATASGNGGVVSNTQVQYLDVGLTLEVEPTIYADNDVAIKVNLEVSSIINTDQRRGRRIAYEIGTRNATTLLQLKDGETQILAGLIQDSDTRSASKIPGLGDIPLLGRLFSDHTANSSKSEDRAVDHPAHHPRQAEASERHHGILVRHRVAQRPDAAGRNRWRRGAPARGPGGTRCRRPGGSCLRRRQHHGSAIHRGGRRGRRQRRWRSCARAFAAHRRPPGHRGDPFREADRK